LHYSASGHVRFIVTAGHIHNYERFLQSGNIYLVSGGGGAKPVRVVRDQQDQYQESTYPNYHYIKFVVTPQGIDASMIRLETPNETPPTWRLRDHFEIPAP
jgi:acid phosphatase type 7